jgi:hypothetical protein
MRAIIGAKLLASSIAQPAAKPFEIYDTRLPGFALRVQPSGVRSYYARFGRNRRISLGKVGELLPDEARGKCQKVLGNVAHGRHPLSGLLGPDGPTLGEFVQETFTPWAQANRPRSAANTLEKLHRHFGSWFAEPLSVITVERIESWKQRRSGTTLHSVLLSSPRMRHLDRSSNRRDAMGPAQTRSSDPFLSSGLRIACDTRFFSDCATRYSSDQARDRFQAHHAQ